MILSCGGRTFTAKGRSVLVPGWKTYEAEKPEREAALPDLTEGQTVPVASAQIKEGKTTPPKHYTEETLLSAMETAGAKEAPDDAEHKGIGTPATRAAILEKLVASGFVRRQKSRKVAALIPSPLGTALITVLPEELQSPLLTAEWEQRLKEIERREREPEVFMEGIAAMLRELVKSYTPVPGAVVLFPADGESVGKCPRCGKNVVERKQGFFCEDRDCGFALWKNSRFFSAKKKQLTASVVKALLKDGRVQLTGCRSEKTGKTYDAVAIMTDDGKKVGFRLEFGNGDGAA